jgi:hypothetical protein
VVLSLNYTISSQREFQTYGTSLIGKASPPMRGEVKQKFLLCSSGLCFPSLPPPCPLCVGWARAGCHQALGTAGGRGAQYLLGLLPGLLPLLDGAVSFI